MHSNILNRSHSQQNEENESSQQWKSCKFFAEKTTKFKCFI